MKTLPWTRFWRPIDQQAHLGENGLLVDPEEVYGKALNENVRSLAQLDSVQCLVLLGEPGIGKSVALAQEKVRLATAVGHTLHGVELKDYGQEDGLFREVFESQDWTAWKEGEGGRILFFDSLDEGLLRISHLARVITRGLRTGPRDRLRVRIACRTADWPASFQGHLEEHFGRDRVETHVLLPLRAKDVREAAQDAGVDPDAFLSRIASKKVGPLAAKPVTLRFLLSTYRAGAELPSSRAALYEQGCLDLCKEPDRERREALERRPFDPHFEPEICMAVASRIAAAMLFANRSAVATDDGSDASRVGDVVVSNLVGGHEGVPGPFPVDADAVRAALRTGLFSAQGPSRLGWTHRSYAEFLAARYVKGAPIAQIRSLLTDSGSQVASLVPQLWEVAAWIAAERDDVLSWITSTEPEVLLRSDTSLVRPELMARLVTALLARFEADDLPDTWELRGAYPQLTHAGLAAQLEPFIRDKAKKLVPRRAAIAIAEACRVLALQSLLADVALDSGESQAIREQAAHAVWRIAGESTRARLLPLARGQAGPDPEDELRGLGLYCVWPRLMNTADLLSCIVPPKCPSHLGRYSHFLTEQAAETIPADDLPSAITRAADWLSGRTHPNPLLELVEQLIGRAWALLDCPGVKSALAGLLVACARTPALFWGKRPDELQARFLADQARRRDLLEELLSRSDLTAEECDRLLISPLRLIVDDDVLWLLERIEGAPTDRRPLWARCIARNAGIPTSAALVDRILILREREPALAREYAWLEAWDLDSPRARKAKADHLRYIRMERGRAPLLLEPSPEERVAHDLVMIEGGDLGCWVDLTFDLTLEPTSTAYGYDVTIPIEERPGWKSATAPTRERIAAAARVFLSNHIPGNAWLGGNQTPWPLIAGLLALQLLEEDVLGGSLPRRVLENWSPALIGRLPASEATQERLLQFAYGELPDAVLRNAELLLDREDEASGEVFCLPRLEPLWDARMGATLLGRLERGGLKPGSAFALGNLLLSRGAEGAAAHCAGQIPNPTEMGAHDRRLIVQYLALLLIHAPKTYWQRIWSYFAAQPEVAEEALIRVVSPRDVREGTFLAAMDAGQLGDLYFWLSKRFPAATDPHVMECHSVTPRERCGELRTSVLGHLVERGTSAACDRLVGLVDTLPEQRPWLRWQLREARMKARSNAWVPPTVPEVVALFQDRQRRYVNSEPQLLSVIVDSLDRLQERFKERPSVLESLWSYDGGGMRRTNFRPKDEESLSDYIADWLKDDLGPSKGVIVNREVQPRRGQKTDVYVNAVVPGSGPQPADCLTVVIELKGCWNGALWTAMQTQLVDVYMTANALGHGVYLVGWYLCNAWSDKDSRKRDTPRDSLDSIRARLLSQAKQIAEVRPQISLMPHVLDLGIGGG